MTGPSSLAEVDSRPRATISVDLDPVDTHLRGYGHHGLAPDPLVPRVALPRLLEVFARHGVRATFFLLAREVDDEQAAVRAVAAAEHEVASHTVDHPSGLAQLPDDRLAFELRASRQRLTGLGGTEVVGFRAPDWSVGRRLVPALADAGYRYDASLVPSPILLAGRALLAVRAGRPRDLLALRLPSSFRRRPFRWRVSGREVVEYPLAVSPVVRFPIYHTLRDRLSDAAFERHLDGFVARGEAFSYALHGVDALGLMEDGVDPRLSAHPGMGVPLDAKLDLLERTVAAIAARFDVLPYRERLPAL